MFVPFISELRAGIRSGNYNIDVMLLLVGVCWMKTGDPHTTYSGSFNPGYLFLFRRKLKSVHKQNSKIKYRLCLERHSRGRLIINNKLKICRENKYKYGEFLIRTLAVLNPEFRVLAARGLRDQFNVLRRSRFFRHSCESCNSCNLRGGCARSLTS